MSHEIIGARPWAYLDDAPLEERRARAVVLRRALPAAEADDLGALDPAAVAEAAELAWPDVRDAEELHDALLELGVLPARSRDPSWEAWLDALVLDGRATRALDDGRELWIAAERVALARALLPGARLAPDLAPLAGEAAPDSIEEAATRVLRGWMPRLGPTTAARLATRLGVAESLARDALLGLELEGLVLRGRFLADAPWSAEAPHWCERGVLARIHRLTLGRLRREIEPVSTADLLRFFTRWQHALPGARLHGARGLAEVVGQLQGFHAAAGAWERELLPARVAGYEPALLDALCLGGEVAWGRLAVGPDEAEDEAPRRRAAPTRNAPVTLALRGDLAWLAASGSAAHPERSGAASPERPADARTLADRLLLALARGGASFLGDLAAAIACSPREAERAMWELVSAGAATCDGFAGLRSLIDAERPRHPRRGGFAGGRWALVARPELERTALVERQAEQLLRRWGVVFRDLLAREPLAPPWRDLVQVYRRREARGELRGGRFVGGFSGEQFALPGALDALRAVRRSPRAGGERVELCAADPLNLVGILTPGPRVPCVLGQRIAFEDGVPAPAAERQAAS